nr:hypothetical protein CFP56_63778 [Quercus suber]
MPRGEPAGIADHAARNLCIVHGPCRPRGLVGDVWSRILRPNKHRPSSTLLDSPVLDVEVQLYALAAAASPKAADKCISSPSSPRTRRHLERPSPLTHSRTRTDSITSGHCAAIDQNGAVQKRRSQQRERSVSTSQAHRLHQLAYNQPDSQPSFATTLLPLNWITAQHSPQQHHVFNSSIDPFPNWTAPTPPRSDSGVPPLSIDANDDSVTCSPQAFSFPPTTTSPEMSSLEFLLPSQYGSGGYETEPNNYAMDHNYIPPMRVSQAPAPGNPSAYGATSSSSPALYQSRLDASAAARRHSEMPRSSINPSYEDHYRRISTPYEQHSSANAYSLAPGQNIPSISGLTQNPSMTSSSGSPAMSQHAVRSPNTYEASMYTQAYSATPQSTQMYEPSAQAMGYPSPYMGSSVNPVASKPSGNDPSSIRVLNQRPKPQCWEHGCNGRQFSTFSNLLRHQREKSGTASKSSCPRCGAEFTRTTARNGHLAHDKCTKQRRPSDDDDNHHNK